MPELNGGRPDGGNQRLWWALMRRGWWRATPWWFKALTIVGAVVQTPIYLFLLYVVLVTRR